MWHVTNKLWFFAWYGLNIYKSMLYNPKIRILSSLKGFYFFVKISCVSELWPLSQSASYSATCERWVTIIKRTCVDLMTGISVLGGKRRAAFPTTRLGRRSQVVHTCATLVAYKNFGSRFKRGISPDFNIQLDFDRNGIWIFPSFRGVSIWGLGGGLIDPQNM